MIRHITYSNSKTNTASLTSPNQNKSSPKNTVPPTYSNDTASKTSDTVQVSIINVPTKSDRIKALEMAINENCSFVPTPNNFDDGSKYDFHVYKIGDNGEKIELPFASKTVVSQVNDTKERSYCGLLQNGKTCEIKLQNSSNSSEEVDKPLDSTTFKNVILKAMKLLNSANTCKESITGEKNTVLSNSLTYDPNTRTADFKAFIESNEKLISEFYGQHSECIEDSKINSATYHQFQNDIWDLMNKIL